MKYLLDSNTCIEAMRSRPSPVKRRLVAAAAADLAVCTVGVGELRSGAERSASPVAEHAKIDQFLAPFHSLPFDTPAAEEYARVRYELERAGQRIGQLDMQIAAIARLHGLTVVTHNTKDFGRVPGLSIEDWQLP